jgi:hypothetical protein
MKYNIADAGHCILYKENCNTEPNAVEIKVGARPAKPSE